jgi:hypothetical protein
MFGFARSQHLALAPEAIRTERAHYCGLCHALRRDYGMRAVALTNFEGRFLALLVNAQSRMMETKERIHCPLPPFAVQQIAPYNTATRFAAATTLYLIRQKLVDDAQDDNSRMAQLLLQLGTGTWAQAEDYLRSIGLPFAELEDCRRQQQEIESMGGSPSFYTALEPSARAMASLFALTSDLAQAPKNRERLASVGAEVGKLVCLLDACQDYRVDQRRDRFNPILASWGSKDALSFAAYNQLVNIIGKSLFCIQAEVQRLDLQRFGGLIENTLTLGIAQQAKRTLRLMLHQLGWSKPDIARAHQCLSRLPDTDVCDQNWRCRSVPPSPWKTWLMQREIQLRTGRLADWLQPVWTSFRLQHVPDLSEGLLSNTSLILGSLFLSLPTRLDQGGDCEEACGTAGCCGYGLVQGTASLLGISPLLVLCCCCILVSNGDNVCDDN